MFKAKTGVVLVSISVLFLLLHLVTIRGAKLDELHAALSICRVAEIARTNTATVNDASESTQSTVMVIDSSVDSHEDAGSPVSDLAGAETASQTQRGDPMPAISAHSELTENTVNANESHPASGLVSYEYDNDGAPVREVFDSNGDGVPEATLAVHRNRNNTEEKWELDLNGDGVSDGVYTSRFDSYENTLQQELDMDGDGIPDKIYVSTYDSNGNRIRRETDTDGDGAINEVQINEYYGADNTQLRKHNDMQEDKVIGETELFMSFMSGVAAQTLVEQ